MAERIEIQVVSRGAGRTRREIEGIGRSAQGSVRGLRQLQLAISALGVGVAARQFVELADATTRINNRLNLLTGSQIITNGLFRELEQVARDTRGGLSDTVDLFSRISRSTEDLGLSTQELLDVTTGVNQAFRIYGNSAAEAEAATIQFSQGLAAGALRGDELRSVLEQAPRLARAIADGISETEALGPGIRVGIGDLRELGKEGQLTAEIVTEALQTQLGALREEFAQTTPTISEAIQLLGNDFLSIFRDIDQETGVVENLAESIIGFSAAIRPTIDFLREFVGLFVEFASGTAGVVNDLLGEGAAQAVALSIGIAAISAALNINPLVILATSAVGAVAAMRNLRNATTEVTDATNILAVSIQTENEAVNVATSLLDENRIITEEQAQAKLKEAIARRENLVALKAEGEAQLEASRNEIRAILAVAAARQENAFRIGGVIVNPFANLELLQLEGQVLNAFEAFKFLEAQVDATSASFQQNEDNIQRLNELIASGTLDSREAGRARLELAELQRKAAKDAADEAVRQAARAAKALEELELSIGLIPTGARAGADALSEIAKIREQITEQVARDLVTEEQASRLRQRLRIEEAASSQQAASDIIADLRTEREELMLSTDELELRNRVKEAGLNIANVSDEQLADLRAEITLTREANELKERETEILERRNELIASLGNRDEIARLAEEAAVLQDVIGNEGGLFDVDQINDAQNRLQDVAQSLRDIRLEAGEGSITDGFLSGIAEFSEAGTQVLQEFGLELANVTEQLTGGFADAIAGAIVDGEDFGEAIKEVARDALKQLISSLVQLGLQFLINQAIALTVGASTQAALVAQAGALASAYAAPAALVSLATAGANSIPATAGIVATSAVSQGIAALALRDGGLVAGPGGPRDDAVPAMLSNGEFVVNAQATRENRQILEAINSGGSRRGNRINNSVNINLPGVTDADSFRESERQIEKSLSRRLSRS